MTLRHAVRSLSRSKGFTAVAILSLGLALGLNTTMFAVLDTVLYPRVPYRAAEQLVTIYSQGGDVKRLPSRYALHTLLRDETSFHSGVGAATFFQATVTARSRLWTLNGSRVSRNLLAVLGVRPVLGVGPDGAGVDENTVIISFRLWQRLFPGRESLGGATVTIDGRSYAVAGVMPRDVTFPIDSDFWIPLPAHDGAADKLARATVIVARMKPGLPPGTVEAQLRLIAARLEREFGAGENPLEFRTRPVARGSFRFQNFHYALIGAAVAVLLIACANIANLLLARGMSRRRDLVVRAVLGASRWALAREMLAECMLLAVAGGVLGMFIALWGIDFIAHVLPPQLRGVGLTEPRLSWRVFAFGAIASAVTVALCGLWPAYQASRASFEGELRDGSGTTTGRSRRYSVLVMVEIGLSVVLLMSAGLLARAANKMADFDFGFDAKRVLSTWLALRPAHFPTGTETARVYAAVLERARQLGSVESAATMAGDAPVGDMLSYEPEAGGVREHFMPHYRVVSPDLLRTFGVRMTEGRDFTDGDVETAGAVIVDEALARRLWPYGGAVGRMVKLGDARSSRPWLRIVGVSRPARFWLPTDPEQLYAEPSGMLYALSNAQDSTRTRTVVVRTRANPGTVAVELRRELEALVPQTGLSPIASWATRFEAEVEARRFIAGLFMSFAGVALVLSAIGLYGVLSYTVTQRTREFGVRMALGARRIDVLRIVLHDGFVMVLAGTGVGALLAMWSANLLRYWLYGIPSTDVATLLVTEGLLFAVAFVACYLPARHATRADPLEVLRAV